MSRRLVGLIGKTITETAYVRTLEAESDVVTSQTLSTAAKDPTFKRAQTVCVEIDGMRAPVTAPLRAVNPQVRLVAALVRAAGPSADELSAQGFAAWLRVLAPSDLRVVAQPAAPASRVARRGTVLVVEDDPALRDLAHQLLEDAGHHVQLAETGPRALELMRATQPDVVLLDIMLPGMDGREVCRQMRARPETAMVPVIFVSAIDGLTDKLRAFEAGGNDFVCKPYDEGDLLRKVANLLDVVTTRRMLDARR
jgi:CheY-like chemotaxis protein